MAKEGQGLSEQQPLLEISQLGIAFGQGQARRWAVCGLDLALYPGETLALLGESGCGKSLTAQAIMGLLPAAAELAASSKILFQGKDLIQLSEAQIRALRGRKIAIIFQDPMTSLNPVMKVGKQIEEVIACHFSLSARARYERVLALLAEVNIDQPALRYHAYPHELSGGMQQRVAIAMAIAGEPEILLADEPTTALDVTLQAQILELLRQLQQKHNTTILFITHNMGVVRQIADRVAVMYAGHVVEIARCDSFFAGAAHPYSQALFVALPDFSKRKQALFSLPGQVQSVRDAALQGCRFVDRCPQALPQCQDKSPACHALSAAHEVRCHLYQTQRTLSVSVYQEPVLNPLYSAKENSVELLRTVDLKVAYPLKKGIFRRTYDYVRAVDEVNLTIHAGQTLALVGESGCGKTTLAQSLVQLLQPTAGRVYFKQQEILKLHKDRRMFLRRQIQMIFQDPFSAMDPRMLVGDIIAEGVDALGLAVNAAARQAKIDQGLTQVGLPVEAQYRYPHEFSGGQRQRICIARALAVNPALIICDEPTSALDVSVQAQVLNLLRNLQINLGVAYLFITHDLSVVAYLADQIAVMHQGKIVEYGDADTLLHSPQHAYTQQLLSAVAGGHS